MYEKKIQFVSWTGVRKISSVAYGSTLLKYTAQQKFSTDFNIMAHFERP